MINRGGGRARSARQRPEHCLQVVNVFEGLGDGVLAEVSPGDGVAQSCADFFCAAGGDAPEVNSVTALSAISFARIERD